MSNTNKQPASPEDFVKYHNLKNYRDFDKTAFTGRELKAMMAGYAKEIIRYTLEQAAEKGLIQIGKWDHNKKNVEITSEEVYWEGHPEDQPYPDLQVQMDKQSILSLEEQIIKDLSL